MQQKIIFECAGALSAQFYVSTCFSNFFDNDCFNLEESNYHRNQIARLDRDQIAMD